MANAHLPNSHPDVTPNWRPLKYERTPFAKALVTTLVDGTDNTFSGFVHRDYCGPGLHPVAHGGFCASLIMATSRKYFASKDPEKNQPDPISLHIQYLDPIPQGPVTVTIKDLKLGSKTSFVQVELTHPKSPRACILAIITHGNLSAKGHSIATPLFEVPDRRTECQRWTDPFFYYFSPTSALYRTYTRSGGPNPMWSPSLGQNARDMWCKLDDDNDTLTMAHLGFMADGIPDIPKNFETGGLKAFLKWATPTVSLSLDILSDCQGEEWLLSRAVMNHCTNGRFDMDVKFITDKGKLVATAKQNVLLIDVSKKDGKAKASL